jgi:FlaG/FlaF family flagellin (archaellin)
MTAAEVADGRGVSSGIATIFMVAVVVLLGATLSIAFGATVDEPTPAPTATFDYQKHERGASPDEVEITLTGGEPLVAKKLMVVASEPVDLGTPGNYWSEGETTGEKVTEGNDQVQIGETWNAGESIFLSRDGELEGVTVRLVWNPVEVDKDGAGGREASDVIGEDSYVLLRFTVK